MCCVTVRQAVALEAVPNLSVVILDDGTAMQKRAGQWRGHSQEMTFSSSELIQFFGTVRLVHAPIHDFSTPIEFYIDEQTRMLRIKQQ